MPSRWGITPRRSVERECERVGSRTVVSQCLDVLTGEEVEASFLFVIGGPAARQVLDGREGGPAGQWPKVWALRALLYTWDGRAAAPAIAATTDEAWRVREMAAKVIGRHRLDDGLEALGRLTTDDVPRVRAAAARSRQQLTIAGT